MRHSLRCHAPGRGVSGHFALVNAAIGAGLLREAWHWFRQMLRRKGRERESDEIAACVAAAWPCPGLAARRGRGQRAGQCAGQRAERAERAEHRRRRLGPLGLNDSRCAGAHRLNSGPRGTVEASLQSVREQVAQSPAKPSPFPVF